MEGPTAADAAPLHAQVDASESDASELARSLPALVAELKKLREEMAKKTKVYEHLVGPKAAQALAPGSSHADDRLSGRQSLYTPLAGPETERVSVTGGESAFRGDLSAARASSGGSTRYSDSFSSHGASYSSGGRNSHPNYRQYQPPQYQRPTAHRTLARQASAGAAGMGRSSAPWDYSVMWVSGECGISLRNFSADKVGAQVAVLQHADGVTTGIANCRLGDQLVTVNDERVDDMRFRDIVQKLKTTRRPISLGFRTNQNVATSPRASGSGGSASSSSFAHTAPIARGSFRQSLAQNQYQPQPPLYGEDELLADRQTSASTTSSTGTLSDDVELWCKEQEEMHAGLLVLLTETVLRCERLQQENLDQLQNIMQLAPPADAGNDLASETSSGSNDKLLALTSPMSAASSSFSRGSPEDEPSRPSTSPKRAPPPPVPVDSPLLARRAEDLVL